MALDESKMDAVRERDLLELKNRAEYMIKQVVLKNISEELCIGTLKTDLEIAHLRGMTAALYGDMTKQLSLSFDGLELDLDKMFNKDGI